MTGFLKKNGSYWASYVASDYYFLLGLMFSDNTENGKDSSPEIEVTELYSKWDNSSLIQTSKEDLLAQVENGLKRFNEEMNTHYSVSKVSYPPCQYSKAQPKIYDTLTLEIVWRYHHQEEFPDHSPKP